MGKQDDGRVSLWMLLPVLLLYAFLAFAADETLYVVSDDDTNSDSDVDLSPAGAQACGDTCNDSTNCYTAIDEGSGSEDDNLVSGDATSSVYVGNWDTPEQNPSTDTDAQSMTVVASICDESCAEDPSPEAAPSMVVYLYCGGSVQGSAIYGPVAVGGDYLDEVHTFDWTFPDSGCEADGSDAQVGLNIASAKSKTDYNYTCWESAEWDVTWEVASDRRVFTVGMHPEPNLDNDDGTPYWKTGAKGAGK